MSRYLMKYIGRYRVLANYDLGTNDFPRLKNGLIDPSYEDIYIICKNQCKIYHYGGNVLEAYIPSLQRGRNILKQLYVNCVNSNLESFYEFSIENNKKFDYEKLYEKLIQVNLILSIQETDEELLFKFKNKYIDEICKVMQAKTSGASISPFSVKNLPTNKKYHISMEEINEYREITACVNKVDSLVISQVTRQFLSEVVPKKKRNIDVNRDMRLKMLKGKEYIHSIGLWKEFMKYLKDKLQTKIGDK